jgi:acetyltransferase-like isoleucine patch superfamily enzyme
MSANSSTPSVEQQSAEVAAQWYVAPKPAPPVGWLVFSDEYILRGLRGEVSASAARPGAGLTLAARVVRGTLCVVQLLTMAFAKIPLLNQIVESWVSFLPRGALGSFLRAAYWKARLGRLGQDTIIERGVEIWGAANIEIGSRCHIDAYARLAAGESGYGQRGSIRIGDYTHIGPRAHLAGRGGLTIGDFVAIEACAHVYSATNTLMHPRFPGQVISLSHTSPPDFQHVAESPLAIDDYAIVGFASLVLPGAWLGRGAIVHPYTVVTARFHPFANVSGPGRGKQNGWRRPLRRDARLEAPASPQGQAS